MMEPKKPSKLHLAFVREVAVLVANMQKTLNETRAKKPEKEEEFQSWAEEWLEKAGDFNDQLMEYVERVDIEESCKEVDWRENHSLIVKLIELVKEINKLNEPMYWLVNYFQRKRVEALKIVFEKRAEAKKAAAEKQKAIENEKKLAQREENYQKRRLEREQQYEKIREQARRDAIRDHNAEWLLKKAAEKQASAHKRALRFHEDASIINDDDYEDRKNKRRSRSFGRRIIKKVEKTIRRSVSAVSNMIHH